MKDQLFTGKTFLITGIADENSLAMYVAKNIIQNGLDEAKLTFFDKPVFHQYFFEKYKILNEPPRRAYAGTARNIVAVSNLELEDRSKQ